MPAWLAAVTFLTLAASNAVVANEGLRVVAPAGAHVSESFGVPWRADEPLPTVPAPAQFGKQNIDGPLTLVQLTDVALANNPATREAWAAARAEAAGLGIARALYYPRIDALINFTHSKAISSGGVAVPAQTRYGPSVSLAYLLFDFGARHGQVEAARYRLLAANLTQNRVLQDVVVLVEQTYYLVLGLEQLIGANREALLSVETSLAAAKVRRAAGLATLGDVYRAETAVGQARLALRRNEGEVAKARGQLATAAGLPVNTVYALAAVPEEPPIESVRESIDGILAEAKATRPDLVAAEAQARAALAGVRVAQSAALPTLELATSAGRTSFDHDRPSSNSYSIGLNLRIPLFSGFSHSNAIRQAEAVADAAAASRDRLTRQTELEVWQAYFDLDTAASGVDVSRSVLRSADQSAEVALGRYKAGVGSLLDLLTAQADQANARVAAIQAQLDWYTGLARLTYARGALPSISSSPDKP